MLDCEYYPMGTADFNAPQHRERILQIISDFVKDNTTEEQMREAYRMAALDRANAELDDFFTNFN
jgi:site-specific DNA-cytosine methylase